MKTQPAVNGARSDHPVYGWGGGGGRVYQKAYVEFFASEALLDKILEACKSRAELNYYAVGVSFFLRWELGGWRVCMYVCIYVCMYLSIYGHRI